jgi:hypothetical protein
MSLPPSVNPNVNDIADRAKHAYAIATRELAALQYRLGELAGTGQIDPEESMNLQCALASIWESLYSGTLCAVRDEDTDDLAWDEDGNTYSDGRTVMTQIRIEPQEIADLNWEYNRFTCGDGAVNEHPRGTICCIAHHDPRCDHVVGGPAEGHFGNVDGLPGRLQREATELSDQADPARSDEKDGIK